ncbi:MAG TPA: MMPL family transporter, partial [Corynebacterium urealyticum]|nr:MMPL family transporter [Corynebacterium urealyticum]
MAKFLFHLGRWSFTRKWLAIGIWLVVLVAIGAAALTGQKGFNDVFEIDDMPSTHATELLQEKFPEMGDPGEESIVNVVFQAPEGEQLKDPDYMAAMDRTVEAIKQDVQNLGDTLQLHNPVTMNDGLQKELVQQEMEMGLPRETALQDAHTLRAVSDDGRTGVLSFTFDVPVPADVTDEDRQAVTDAMNISRDAGLTVEAGGLGFADPVAVEPISEIAGLAVAMIILWVTFASLLAAGLPLLTAVVGIGIGTLLTVGATFFVPLNSMTPTLGLMLGLAVGIDYALFIMARYRDELRHGRSRLDAIGLAT